MTTNSKNTVPHFFGVHANPAKWLRFFLGTIPFVIILLGYQLASDIRHKDNPSDKLLPSFGQMWESMKPMVIEPDKRTGDYRLYEDTKASLKRLLIGVGVAFLLALWLGLNSGFFGGMSALTMPMVTFISMIPPMALLPILFISLGINELGKITLIFIGTFPIMARDIYLATRALPGEQITKTLTLGGSQLAHVYRIALPQIMPCAFDTLRLSLGAAWLFVIASEAIAATEGLGYRIFLVRRYMSMDIIIPYVAWITLLGLSIDYFIRVLQRKLFPWYQGDKK